MIYNLIIFIVWTLIFENVGIFHLWEKYTTSLQSENLFHIRQLLFTKKIILRNFVVASINSTNILIQINVVNHTEKSNYVSSIVIIIKETMKKALIANLSNTNNTQVPKAWLKLCWNILKERAIYTAGP